MYVYVLLISISRMQDVPYHFVLKLALFILLGAETAAEMVFVDFRVIIFDII